MEKYLLYFVNAVLTITVIYYFIRKNDEIPLIFQALNLIMFRRYIAISEGLTDWINFDYSIHFTFNEYYAFEAFALMTLGTGLFILSYFYFVKKGKNYFSYTNENTATLKAFILNKRRIILFGFLIFAGLNIFAKNEVSEVGIGNTSSYLWLLTLANSSFIILLFLLFKNFKLAIFQKVFYLVIFLFVAYSTFNSYLRFQFIGWAVAIIIIIASQWSPVKKGLVYILGIFILLVGLNVAGLLRNAVYRQDFTFSEVVKLSVSEKVYEFSDLNMIDGFIMVLQVYPDILEYRYGLEHLGIFIRPIPRFLWKDKPVGSWHQRYGKLIGQEFHTGIGGGLFSSFYEEGGIIGVIIFSILYGYLFAKLLRYQKKYNSILKYTIRGIIIASITALIRGGDIPGIYAFIGMSYWPILLFINRYNKFLKHIK